ncbi:MAG: hypothetical protein AAFQ94_12500 [Bacteroidota bacterium]
MSLIRKWQALSPKKVFLIDGLGAIVTATMLLLVLSNMTDFFGVSKDYLQILGIIAVAFSIYSFSCYFTVKQKWKPYLKIIAVANFLYCLLTAGLIVYLHEEVTVFGVLYFAAEALVVLILVYLEFKKINQRY